MLQLIWKLCTFQARPVEVPYSVPLLGIKIIINLFVLVLILTISTSSIWSALWRSLIFVGIIISYSSVLLSICNFTERSVQLISGLLASMSMILASLGIPYVIIMFFLTNVTSNALYYCGLIVSGCLLGFASMWLYVVFARIYKHALEITVNEGLVTSLILFIICAVVFWFF